MYKEEVRLKIEYIKQTSNKVPMYEIFINLTCINRKLVYSEHKGWPQGGLICTGLTVFVIVY
jgi:hypothetical protein